MSLLGLVPDYGSDSSSSSESDEEESKVSESGRSINEQNSGNKEGKAQIPLPLPSFDVSTHICSSRSLSASKELNQRAYQTSSVFFNPFLAEEKKRLSVLEKHVQLSEGKSEKDEQKSKKICFKFQKGRCRMGDRCKFSHGIGSGSLNPETEQPREPSLAATISTTETRYEPDEDEERWEPTKKKRKSGVTDSLIPPKRALASFEKQKRDDKPWTPSL
ncbi:uncharacterized protein LOC111330108 isoform X1 [Stylophora pistillata]|nr:uncharacterized protein LOC111330108 isoform X1 [Stylophora pistillata]